MDSWRSGVSQLASSRASAESQIASAERRYAEGQAQYADGQESYQEKLSEYNDALPDALQKISDGEADLADARARLAKLALPSYEADTRREALGSEAYKTYDTVSQIVDSLANVFPVLLYLAAAFVTLSTMTRMVEEERIGAGTLKALGYHDGDVALKFVLYGGLAGGVGAVLGIVLGHTLLPWIVYSAYSAKFTLSAHPPGLPPGRYRGRRHPGRPVLRAAGGPGLQAGALREARGAASAQVAPRRVEDLPRAREAGLEPPELHP